MKAEYADANGEKAVYSIFPNHHQPRLKFPVHPFPHRPAAPHHRFNPDDPPATPPTKKAADSPGDGSTVEVSRRPRGRPPGSKNKPKPPLVITRDPDSGMNPYVLEVPGGVDVAGAVTRFSRRRNLGLCVLAASGIVVNVSLRQPSAAPSVVVTFNGRLDILSLSATLLLPSSPCHADGGFTVSLAGPQGQIVGGMVSGPLLAAGTVCVIAASLDGPSYHRLPPEHEESGGMSPSGNEDQSPPRIEGGGSGGQPPGVEMSMYSGHHHHHLPPPDVVWPPGGRQPTMLY